MIVLVSLIDSILNGVSKHIKYGGRCLVRRHKNGIIYRHYNFTEDWHNGILVGIVSHRTVIIYNNLNEFEKCTHNYTRTEYGIEVDEVSMSVTMHYPGGVYIGLLTDDLHYIAEWWFE